DIFLCGNQVSNRLYLNKGNLRFEDITEKAGLWSQGVWTTGVTMADINEDGWLDIYICKSGPPGGQRRHNELFINNGNLTFTEQSKQYGLDFTGLSVHATFFDYDLDGDLDCYLLNNSIRSVGQFDLRKDQRNIPDPLGGNKLLRNDAGKFLDVTLQAGIYSSLIGFGLGVAVSDINLDGWPDLYIANDFFEKDYLYINQRNGTFKEQLEERLTEISLGSMGADIADLTNDGNPEIYVTEMLPESDWRLKTTSQFEDWNKYRENLRSGYYHQFSRNVLQLNNGNGTFSEVGRYAGVHATDWSWGALLFEMDNDGWKDIFVANGIYKDLLNQDYVNFIANPVFIRNQIKKGAAVISQLMDTLPSNKLNNYFFRNNGDMTFSNMTASWAGELPSFSNGSAYGDLDNDGDPDLVVNNINMPAFVLENRTTTLTRNNYVTIQLEFLPKNIFGIGSKIWIKSKGNLQYQELFPSRGFMSTVDFRLHFGLGTVTQIDSLIIQWPDRNYSVYTNLPVNQLHVIRRSEASLSESPFTERKVEPCFRPYRHPDIRFTHVENEYNDFNHDRLLFIMTSNEGPCLCTGDINKDGQDDFYIGGAVGQAGRLYVQRADGTFYTLANDVFDEDSQSEDTDCLFFDANSDGFDDLFVASGGREYSSSSTALIDRLYFSEGGKKLAKSSQVFPGTLRFEPTSSVAVADFNKDGFPDLFLGVRYRPQAYGLPADSYLLMNDGKGNFTDVTSKMLPELKQVGMVTSAVWADVNSDDWPDLIVAGEWMPLRLFINEKQKFTEQTANWGLSQTQGWYNTIATADFNKDGRVDLVAGNHGLNSMFRASPTQPLAMWVGDFDENGTLEQLIARHENGSFFTYALLPEFLAQMPSYKKKFLYYKNYAGKPVDAIIPSALLERSYHVVSYDMRSAMWLNTGTNFIHKPLPPEAQFMPIYAFYINDVDGDGNLDLIAGGNQSRAKPQTGTYQAGHGLMLKGHGDGTFVVVSPEASGLHIRGDIRQLAGIRLAGKTCLLVGVNNDELKLYNLNCTK
ncbi:MAG: VCBS repeat-containing protein, partial [Cyclobacteriaceae bacterium]|nr:VCBS repeat-containing protein [Cyclobacteriaceae bacterium]